MLKCASLKKGNFARSLDQGEEKGELVGRGLRGYRPTVRYKNKVSGGGGSWIAWSTKEKVQCKILS